MNECGGVRGQHMWVCTRRTRVHVRPVIHMCVRLSVLIPARIETRISRRLKAHAEAPGV